MLINLTVTINKNGSMTVSWPAVANTAKYSGMVTIPKLGVMYYDNKNLTTTSFTTEANLPVKKEYKITVYAFSKKNIQLATGTKYVTIPDGYVQTPLGVPQNVKAKAETISVTVSYDAVARATSYDVQFDGTVYNVTGTSKKINNLKPKTNHTYAVRAKNATQTGAYSATKTVTTLPQSPAVPSNIKKTVTETSATISWNAVSGATSYDVLFNGKTYNVTAASKTFTGLAAGTGYSYQIRAKNASASSAYTNAATVTTAPKAPSAITAVSTENSVTVSWNAVTGARYYRLKFGKEDILVNGTSHTLKGLSANTSYNYQVCSQGPDGTGSYSASKSIKTAPMAPSAPTATVTKNSATVKWNAVTGATGYDLMFNNTVYSTTATSKTVNNLTPGTKYSYSVRAKNAGGSSSYTAAQTLTTTPNPPAAPANVSISVTPDSATVSWSPVTGATSYDVLFNNKTYNVTTTSKTITGLAENTSYNYSVRANNAGGSSAYSASKTVKTPVKPPSAPVNPSTSATENSVTVSWGKVTGAASYDLQFNGTVYNTTSTSKTVSGLAAGTSYGYAVRAKNAGGTSAYSAAKTVTTIPGQPANISVQASPESVTVSWSAVKGAASYDLKFNGTVYNTTGTSKTVTGLREDVNYSYSVCAKNGSGSGSYTASRTVRTPLKPPAAPTGVKAAVTYNSATVSWNASAGATGYDLTFNGQTYAVTGTSKTVSGLAANTNYSYSVRAKNSGGVSAYSASQTVRTLVAPPATPANVTATAGSDTATVSWSTVSGATGYDVKFGGVVYGVTGTSMSFTGLKPKTGYAFAVRAKNAGGAGAYSTEKTVRTLPTVPGVPVVYAAITDAHSIEFAWHAVEDAESYEFLFDGKTYALTELEKKFEGLKADTEYTYRIRAKNIAGVGDYSAVQRIRTRLEAPENIRAEAEAKTVKISFDPVDGATGYDIEFQDATYRVTGTSKVFEGLEPETGYTYAVRAVNGYGCSLFSQTKHVSTLPLVPDMPSDVTALAAFGSVIVSWSPVENAADYDVLFDGTEYHVAENSIVAPIQQKKAAAVFMSLMPGRGMTGAAGDEMPEAVGKAAAFGKTTVTGDVSVGVTAAERIYRIFTGLKPHTRYSYAARANNAKGSSSYTPEQYVTTDAHKCSGLAYGKNCLTYPDGRISYMGNDPVNALTGAFLWSYTWLEDHGKDGIHFTAMYDSRREIKPDVLGKKWTYSLNYLLDMDGEYAYFHTPYDDVAAFRKNAEDGNFLPEVGEASSYTMKENGDGSYSVTASDGTEYVFDRKLCLNRIEENGLASYRFQSDEVGRIIRMEGRHGTGIDIAYTDGNIAAVTDAMGNTVRFAYEEGMLAAVTNPEGREMSFTYDAACRLLTISDFSGEAYLTNSYDVQGRVTEQFTVGRGRSLAAYDDENRTTEFTDELGNVTRYTYDEAGRITDVALAGTVIHNTYNEKGQMTGRTDALGNSTRMEYDEYGRMVRVIHPDGAEESAVYNDRNLPVEVTGCDGAAIRYQYDGRNNLVRMQDERGNINSYSYDENDNLVSFTDRSGHVWTYAYDENNHLEQAADPDGNICLYSYDAIGRMTSYTSPAGRTVSYRYSAAGDLLSVEDADGEIVFEYNGNGGRTGITDRMGNKQRLEYNAMGQVSLVTDCLGNECRFVYDGKGNLITETDPLGYSISNAYDARGNRTSQTDKNGNVTQYTFDAADQLIQVRDAAGGTVSYAYDCMGRVTAVTDQLSNSRSYVYDKAGRVLSETDPLGHSVGYTYDEAGNLLTRTDEDGNVISYAYDAENRLQLVQTDAGTVTFAYDSLGRLASVTDEDGYTESAEYDSDDNLTAASDKEGWKTVYDYDGMGRIAEETAPDGGKTAYAYDRNGNCVQIKDAEGHVSRYEYDANNRLVKAMDPAGQETSYSYDGRGQLVRMTDANGGVTEYAYDGNGNLISETNPSGGKKTYVYDSLDRLTGGADEEGGTWACAYDAAGNRTSFTDANGHVWTYGYDACGRLTSITDEAEGSLSLEYTNAGRVSRVTDMEGAVTDYEYDAMGRLVLISDAMGHSEAFSYDSAGRALARTDANGNVTQYAYSPAGNLLSVTDGEGNATVYTYNALGLTLTETDALGNTVSYTYDHLGQVTSMTDALGNTTSFTYTADGRIASVENAEGGVTRYTYDVCGNLAQTEDALGRVAQYEYDAMNNRIKECLAEDGVQSCVTLYQYDKKGRMVREINPLLEEKTYGYDGNGNLTFVTDEEQRETAVIYDLNNRPVSVSYSDGRTAAFRYNKRGELVEMQDWNGTTAMERDGLGRLTGVKDHNGRKTGFAYDAAGNRTAIRYPDGSVVAYAFDRNNRLLAVTEHEDGTTESAGEIIAQYAYDAAGGVVSLTQPGSAASYAYDANRQPVKVSYLFGGTVSMEEDFTYDALGRITASARGGSRPEFARAAAYGYDAAGQLVSCRNGDAVETYAYDSLGNRTARSLNGIRKAVCQYNALNQLISMTEDGTAYSFRYDRCGNLTEERRGDDIVRQYVYDATGRMAIGKNAESGEESTYAYNALRMCIGNVQKLAAAEGFRSRETQYVPDYLGAAGNELMACETGAGSTRTVFGQGYRRLSQSAADGRTFFQSDIYGSPLFASDGQGAVRQYAERGIWGDLKAGTEALPGLEENLRFTSYRYDAVLGKHFAHARLYDSANGRMLAPDPVRSDLNGYRYCGNDPVNHVDPDGEFWNVVAGAGIGGFFGGIGGFVGSAISQKLDSGKVNWRKAWGTAADGAITGAVQGGLLASGAGVPAALFSNFLAGTAGSAAQQYISGGKVNARESVTGGLTNAISNAIYGIDPLKNIGDAFLRGAGAGAATSGINYISSSIGLEPGWLKPKTGSLIGLAGRLISPFGLLRDPKKGCGSASPFDRILGYGSAKGYRYDIPKAGGIRQKQKKFSLMEFLKETAVGGITGGVASAGFYGAGKGIERLKDGFRAGKSNKISDIEITDYYPSNDGAMIGTKRNIYLMAGDTIDRYGKLGGKYFSPVGTPLEMRALPYDANLTQYTKFEVIKPFEVEASIIAPAFGKIGLGTQYRSAVSANILLKKGILKVLEGI